MIAYRPVDEKAQAGQTVLFFLNHRFNFVFSVLAFICKNNESTIRQNRYKWRFSAFFQHFTTLKMANLGLTCPAGGYKMQTIKGADGATWPRHPLPKESFRLVERKRKGAVDSVPELSG